MIPSSDAQFYLESRQDIYPYQQLIGKTIAVVLYPDVEKKEAGTVDGTGTAHAYICSVGSPATDSDGTNRSKPSFVSGSCQLILRFSASTNVKLIAEFNESTSTLSANTIDRNVQLLQEILGNVKIIPEYYVTETCIDNRLQENIEKYATCKIQHATYCTLQNTAPENQNEIKGCVFSLSVNDDEVGTMYTMEPNPIPTPLLSIRLVQTDGRKISSEDDSKRSPLDTLLQQCLKRLLVNNLVVCPISDRDDDFTGSPSKLSIDAGSNNNPVNHINGNNRSLVSLSVPSLSGSEECFAYKVCDVIPHFKTSRNRRQSTSNIFIILPSTRITLIHVAKEINDPATLAVHPSRAGLLQKPSTMDLILNTINSIRHFSLLRSKGPKTDSYSVDIPRAFLISGPPGTGKTYSVRMAVDATNAQKGSTKTRLISIRGSEILSSGATEADAALELKKQFFGAVEFASKCPENISVIFMDECDALLSSDVAGATLGALLDQMSSSIHKEKEVVSNRLDPAGWKRVIVIAATNRIDVIPSSLRRPGRIDRELSISPPNTKERLTILKSLLHEIENVRAQNVSQPDCISEHELSEIAELCVGYVASDLASLIRRAAFLSTKEDNTCINYSFLRDAMKDVGASALRDSAINAPPSTRWNDIAGDAGGAKTALRRAVEWPQTKKKEFEMLGLAPPRGILLHGPPGCAKTTLARAAAGAAGIAFLSLSPADVYASSYVGEAEAVVRRAFSLARSASPCVLFFDEIDSIVAASSSNTSGMDRSNNAEARVLSTFLNEMDGVDGSIGDGVLVLGATNRPSTLDSALIRPGRFDKVIYVPNPDKEGRQMILKAQCQKWEKNGSDIKIDTDKLSGEIFTGMMTGAEIVGACREAAMLAIREMLLEGDGKDKCAPTVQQHHLVQTLGAVNPLLSDPRVLSEYTSFEEKYAQ